MEISLLSAVPGLAATRTGAPVEVTACVIPAERVEIITPLERDQTAQWPLSHQGTAQARNGKR